MVAAAVAIIAMGSGFGEQASPLPRTTITIPNTTVSFEMVQVPAGKIKIKDKEVEVKSHWVAVHELTWDVMDIYAYKLDLSQEQAAQGVDAESRPSKPYGAVDRGFGHKGFPALSMTFHNGTQFCAWLSKKTGKTFRMPTEAEWEYAARAGETSEPAKMEDYAITWENSDDQTQRVGSKKPNAWGLHDVLGNVGEWAMGLDGKPYICGGHFMAKRPVTKFSTRNAYAPNWQEADAHVPKSRWWLSDAPFVGMRVVCDL